MTRNVTIERQREQLRALWAEGFASGPGRLTDRAAIKAEARRRLLGDHASSSEPSKPEDAP